MNVYPLDTSSTNERQIINLSDYGLCNALVIGRYKYNCAHAKLSDHYHENTIEICYCHKGSQVYTVNNNTYQIKGGDVFVTFPNEVHSTGVYPEEKGVLYWLLIHVPVKKKFFEYSQPDSRAFIDALINLPNRHFKATAEMGKTLENIIKAAQKDAHKLQKIVIQNLIISFLFQTIEAASCLTKAQRQISDYTAKIDHFIAAHYKETLSIELMSSMLNLSESRFKSWFKQEFGVPPLEFILRKRIEEAKRIMELQTEVTMSSIAYDLGFSSPQHFATIFKRYTLLSPKEFKATLKK